MLITTYVNQRDAITELEDKMNNEEQERKITLHHMIDETVSYTHLTLPPIYSV